MMFCRECGKSIHETAINCPQCGVPQGTSNHVNKNDSGTLWLPVPALICGIFAFLAIFDDSSWDEDAYMGMFIFSSVAVILGTIGSANQQISKKAEECQLQASFLESSEHWDC